MTTAYTLQDLLEKTLRITLRDQRIVEGSLTCIDNFGTLLLSNATESTFMPGFFLVYISLFIIFSS